MERLDLSIVIAFITLLFLASISVSLHNKSEPISITVFPEVPKEGQPIFITFNLNNPSLKEDIVNYKLYANGVLLMQGGTLLAQASTKQYTYVYPQSPKLGERITFLVKTASVQGESEKILNMPAYPPQVLSSFVSFASFSTSLMGSSISTSIAAEPFYTGSFANDNKPNIGLIFSIVLILLLIYIELTEPLVSNNFTIIRGLRIRFSRLSAILFIIFMGMVFTKVAMIIG